MLKLPAVLAATFFATAAAAVPIVPFDASPSDNGGTPFAGTDLADALDDNLLTAYTTRLDDTQARGHGVRFDFDVSAFSDITSFSFEMTVRYSSDNNAFQSLRFGAGRFDNYEIANTPIGDMVTFSLTATPAGSLATDLDNYFSIGANTISVWVQTELGAGPGSFTQIEFLEIDADIEGEANVIPLPAGFPLLLAGLGAFGILSRRRTS